MCTLGACVQDSSFLSLPRVTLYDMPLGSSAAKCQMARDLKTCVMS